MEAPRSLVRQAGTSCCMCMRGLATHPRTRDALSLTTHNDMASEHLLSSQTSGSEKVSPESDVATYGSGSEDGER